MGGWLSSTLSDTQLMFHQGRGHERVRRQAGTFGPTARGNPERTDLAEGPNRGWGDRDSRAIVLWQREWAGVAIKVDPPRLAQRLAHTSKGG